jgi:hypothetical protein
MSVNNITPVERLDRIRAIIKAGYVTRALHEIDQLRVVLVSLNESKEGDGQ